MSIKAKYVHTNLIARDWQMLANFYEKVFGCKRLLPERDLSGPWLDRGIGLKDVHIRGIHLLLPGYKHSPTLEIFQYADQGESSDKPVNWAGFGHIAFDVDDVQKAVDMVLAEGGTRIGKVSTLEVSGKGTITFAYVRDPEGNIIELQKWEE